MKTKQLWALVAVLLLALMLSGCDEVENANRTLLVCEGVYDTVHQASKDVYNNTSIPVQHRLDFRREMLPVLQATEGSIRTANVALQTYISAKDAESKQKLIDAFKTLVANSDDLIRAFNELAEAFGKKVNVPEGMLTAFGLLE